MTAILDFQAQPHSSMPYSVYMKMVY